MRPAHWPGFGSFGRRRVVVAAEFEVFKFDGRAFGVHGARGGLGRGGGGDGLRLRLAADQLFEVVRDLRRDFFGADARRGGRGGLGLVGLPVVGLFVRGLRLGRSLFLRQIPGLERLEQAQMALHVPLDHGDEVERGLLRVVEPLLLGVDLLVELGQLDVGGVDLRVGLGIDLGVLGLPMQPRFL